MPAPPAVASPSPRSDTERLFLALWPDARCRTCLLAHRDAWRWNAGAAPVAPRRLHLTLHFIGAVPRDRVAALAAALQVPFEPFSMSFGVPEAWPRGLAVLRPQDLPEPLGSLHAALGQALRSFGWPVERRDFRPHVTLARKATGAVAPAHAPVFRWPVAAYVLMASVPGADYRLVRTYEAHPASSRPA